MDRTKGLGGSDIAPILGLSPWKTAYQVWEEKLGLSRGTEKTSAMSYGLLVEPVIRQWYSDETGRTVRVPEDLWRHNIYPWMVASLDGFTDDGRVLEIKTARSSQDWGEPWTDEIPVYYRTQVEHYLLVTGFEVADVAVSFSGQMPVLYEVPQDKELQEMLIEKELEFWALVESKTPPEPVTYSDMLARFRKSTPAAVTASVEVLAATLQLRDLRVSMKELETKEEELKAQIMKALGENDTLVDIDGTVLATWKGAKPTNRFDAKRFKEEHGDMYQNYPIAGEASRRFLLK